jgi:hypothetical protein
LIELELMWEYKNTPRRNHKTTQSGYPSIIQT